MGFFNKGKSKKTSTDKKKRRRAVRRSFINYWHLINILYLLTWIVYFWVCSLPGRPGDHLGTSWWTATFRACLSLCLPGKSCHCDASCSDSRVTQWQSWTEGSFYLSKHNQNNGCSDSLDARNKEICIKLTAGSVVLCLF